MKETCFKHKSSFWALVCNGIDIALKLLVSLILVFLESKYLVLLFLVLLEFTVRHTLCTYHTSNITNSISYRLFDLVNGLTECIINE